MRAFTRQRGQDGFTLVELLVVIAILGILSGVVVFAVRGVGDKGQAAALETDTRIMQTALETYCAQIGHYPEDPDLSGPQDAMDVLVPQYLSSRSTYTRLTTGNNPDDFPAGVCGDGTTGPMHYLLETVISLVPGASCSADTFCSLDTAPMGETLSMSALPSGKVVAFTRAGVSEYDPNVGTLGTWSKVADYDPLLGGADSPVFIGSGPSSDDCGQMCGKIVMHQYDGGWIVYDPVNRLWLPAGAGSSDPGRTGGGPSSAFGTQILGSDCRLYCGNVLMIYGRGPTGQGKSFAELWDPKTSVFTPVGSLGGPELGGAIATSAVTLQNGRVLVTTRQRNDTDRRWTKILDPTNTPPTILTGDDHETDHLGRPALLANGDVLFLNPSPPGAAEVFHPATGTQTGTWDKTSVPHCGAANETCGTVANISIAGNPSAGVLAAAADSSGNTIGYRLDSSQTPLRWVKTTGRPSALALGASAVIGGACPPRLCGKVLTARNGHSQLYAPP